jgi:hypothetical protein
VLFRSHSDYYANAQNVAVKVKEVAASVAQIPLIGSIAQGAQVEQYADAAVVLFQNAKQSSEVVVLMVGWSLLLIGLSLPAFLVSVILVIVGLWLAKEEKVPARKKR